MIVANNLWERDQLRKLKTREQVLAQTKRCEQGLQGAPSFGKCKEWGRKLTFLDKLLRQVEHS
jgi:hypothetical protein